jgi:hypothetical protein
MAGTTDRLHRISDELLAILKEEVPDIPWTESVIGPSFPQTLTGYICCDTVEYESYTKQAAAANALYTIEIICPDPQHMNSVRQVETLAIQVKDVLRKNGNIDGWALSSMVNRIVFATPAGMKHVGVAIMEFAVRFIDE